MILAGGRSHLTDQFLHDKVAQLAFLITFLFNALNEPWGSINSFFCSFLRVRLDKIETAEIKGCRLRCWHKQTFIAPQRLSQGRHRVATSGRRAIPSEAVLIDTVRIPISQPQIPIYFPESCRAEQFSLLQRIVGQFVEVLTGEQARFT